MFVLIPLRLELRNSILMLLVIYLYIYFILQAKHSWTEAFEGFWTLKSCYYAAIQIMPQIKFSKSS